MKREIKKYDTFEKNCGNDSSFIALISISISLLSFSLLTSLIEGNVNVKSFDFFRIKIIYWFVLAMSISAYYYRIKRS